MRRIAAVFSSKRSDKSDTDRTGSADLTKPPTKPTKSRSSFFKTLSKASVAQLEPNPRRDLAMHAVSTISEHGASSSSTSSRGPSTPNDDQESLGHFGPGKKNWIPLPFIHDKILPPTPLQDPSRPYIPHLFVDDTEVGSSSSSESGHGEPVQLPPSAKLVGPSVPLSPSAYCRAITVRALEPPFSPPPLLVVPDAPLFPRSCNARRRLERDESLGSQLQRKRLLQRLDASSDQRSSTLAGFSNRTSPPKSLSLVLDDCAVSRNHRVAPFSHGLRRWTERLCFEDRMLVYVPAEAPAQGVRCERVYASFAVEAIAYSEHLELLAGSFDDVPVAASEALSPSMSMTPPLALTPSTASISSIPPSPSHSGSTSSLLANTKIFPSATYRTMPSPLRMDSTERADLASPLTPSSISSPAFYNSSPRPASQTSSTDSPIVPVTPPVTQSPKPVVRFVEEDKDKEDLVPLDYVMRIKQARDQKARFLAAERARRQGAQPRESTRPSLEDSRQMRDDLRRIAEERKRLEEEKRRYEVERRKQEEERKKYERERASFERERKTVQEERKKTLYAEELVEARRRRETARQGVAPKSSEGIVAWEGDREKERERRGSEARTPYTRPKYDDVRTSPRRLSSEPTVPSAMNLSVPAGSSPGSSRPPSIATGSIRGSSRPPSMYSTPPSSASAIDIRTRRESKASRRASVVSEGGAYGSQMFNQSGVPSSYPFIPPVPPIPMQMQMNMVPIAMPMQMQMPMMQLQMPIQMPMPTMPYVDMPLLPPSAPFMMGQHGHRPQAQRSHSSSPSRGGNSSGSDKAQSSQSRASLHPGHRRVPSDEITARSSGASVKSSSLPPPAKNSPSSNSLRSMPRSMSGLGYPQSHVPAARPQPVSSRSQASFQNASRPSAIR